MKKQTEEIFNKNDRVRYTKKRKTTGTVLKDNGGFGVLVEIDGHKEIHDRMFLKRIKFRE